MVLVDMLLGELEMNRSNYNEQETRLIMNMSKFCKQFGQVHFVQKILTYLLVL